MSVPHFLESILLPVQNEKNLSVRQDEWIRQCIQMFSDDEIKMYCLFLIISKLESERKKEYVLLFLENNSLFEDFKNIPLTPISYSCFIVVLVVQYLCILIGLNFLNHCFLA